MDASITCTAIASKYGVALSTVQRRKAALESMAIFRHEYSLKPSSFGLRPIEIWVMVEKGKAEKVGENIFKKHNNVFSVQLQMNSMSNQGVKAYVKSSEELYGMLEEIKSITYVKELIC